MKLNHEFSVEYIIYVLSDDIPPSSHKIPVTPPVYGGTLQVLDFDIVFDATSTI